MESCRQAEAYGLWHAAAAAATAVQGRVCSRTHALALAAMTGRMNQVSNRRGTQLWVSTIRDEFGPESILWSTAWAQVSSHTSLQVISSMSFGPLFPCTGCWMEGSITASSAVPCILRRSQFHMHCNMFGATGHEHWALTRLAASNSHCLLAGMPDV